MWERAIIGAETHKVIISMSNCQHSEFHQSACGWRPTSWGRSKELIAGSARMVIASNIQAPPAPPS